VPRPTGRGLGVLGLAAGTYLAGRVIGTWELYLFAFAFLAVVIISWLLVALTGRRIRVTRSVTPERPVAGDQPEYLVVIKNASLLPGPQLTLRTPTAGLTDDDLEAEIESIGPRGQRLLKTRMERVNRGVHTLPAPEAIAEDPLGVASATHRAGDPMTVTVYPRIAFLKSCVLHPELGLKQDWAGQKGLLTPGASEFRGIRPHQPGEPLSHIDWKSTAKTGILMLREMEEPAGADITLLLDGSADQGALLVSSNDPVNALLRVPLTSSYKGASLIAVVADAATQTPEVASVDFGAIAAASDRLRIPRMADNPSNDRRFMNNLSRLALNLKRFNRSNGVFGILT